MISNKKSTEGGTVKTMKQAVFFRKTWARPTVGISAQAQERKERMFLRSSHASLTIAPAISYNKERKEINPFSRNGKKRRL